MKTKRYVLACDLKNNPELIKDYKEYHKKIWPEIKESILASGIHKMDIYNTGNRLFMSIEAGEGFSFEEKAKMDLQNPKVQEWEKLLWKYQQAIPTAKPGEKWVLMDQIFELK